MNRQGELARYGTYIRNVCRPLWLSTRWTRVERIAVDTDYTERLEPVPSVTKMHVERRVEAISNDDVNINFFFFFLSSSSYVHLDGIIDNNNTSILIDRDYSCSNWTFMITKQFLLKVKFFSFFNCTTSRPSSFSSRFLNFSFLFLIYKEMNRSMMINRNAVGSHALKRR